MMACSNNNMDNSIKTDDVLGLLLLCLPNVWHYHSHINTADLHVGHTLYSDMHTGRSR